MERQCKECGAVFSARTSKLCPKCRISAYQKNYSKLYYYRVRRIKNGVGTHQKMTTQESQKYHREYSKTYYLNVIKPKRQAKALAENLKFRILAILRGENEKH
jgi:predicted  nucleic acid-binding Zn-ribbon protein